MKDNRRHRKIDKLPESVIAAVNDAIVNKRKTYKEIEEWLKADGYDISQSAVQRYGKNFLKKLERITMAREQAKTIIETSSGLKTEMSEATSTVAFQLLMDMLINTDSKELDKNTLNAIKTLATLERSTVSREKLKMSYDKGVKEASDSIKRQMREELINYPELVEQMYKIIDDIGEHLK